MKTLIGFAALASCVLATSRVSAAETYPLITSSLGNTSAAETMFTAGWSADGKKQYWSDEKAPHPDADYSAPNLMCPAYVSGSSTNHTFNGHSCTAGHVSLYSYAPNQITFANEGLILKAGADLRDRQQAANTYIINGKVRIDGTSASATTIKKTSADAGDARRVTYRFTGAFSSKEATSVLKLPEYGGKMGLLDLQLAGDVTGYTGLIEVNPSVGTNYLSFVGMDQSFLGTVKLTTNAELHASGAGTTLANVEASDCKLLTIAATNDLTITKLTLASGKTLQVVSSWSPRHAGHLTVTDTSALKGALAFSVSLPTLTKEILTNSTGRCALLTVPTAFENYTVNYPELPVRDSFGTLPEFTLVTETNDTTKTVYLTHKKIILNVKNVASVKDLLTNGSYWSDGVPLGQGDSDRVYWINNNAEINFSRDVKEYTNAFKDVEFVSPNNFLVSGADFEAKRLQLVSTGTAGPLYSTYAGRANTVRDLVGEKDYAFPDVSTFMCGSFEFVGDPKQSNRGIAIQSYDGHFLNFRGPLTCSINITFKARGVNSLGVVANGGYVYFENGMQGFEGKLVSDKSSDFPDWADRAWTFGSAWVVSKTSNLGAPRASFTFDAISLRYLNGIYALSDVTLDELTRGIYVAGGTAADAIGFLVTPANTTLTVKQALRMNGTLKKAGAGTLVLAQAEEQKLTFGSAATGSDTPTANANVFKVQAGKLKVATRFAADGLALSFTNGTSLVVTPDATADAALYNVKGTVSSVGTGALAGKIPVSFDVAGKTCGEELSGVICTVAASSGLTAESFVLAEPKPFGAGTARYVLKVTQTADEDGNKVFTATAAPYGTFIFFR